MTDAERNHRWRLRIACHEAGHAAMHLFFGTAHEIVNVDMRGSETAAATVRSRSLQRVTLPLLRTAPEMAVVGPIWKTRPVRVDVVKHMMIACAGFSAEWTGKHRDPDDFHWLETEYDAGDWEEEPNHDLNYLRSMAAVVYEPNTRRFNRFCNTAAAWTDDAMQHPPMWAAVQALASRLEREDFIEGEDAAETMIAAAGNVPLQGLVYAMGPKWRRRFRW